MVDVGLGINLIARSSEVVNADDAINPSYEMKAPRKQRTVLDLGVLRAAKRAVTKYSCVYVHGQYQKI